MDHYASKAKNVLVPSTQTTQVSDTYNSPSPTLNAPGESLQFQFDDETEEANLDFSQLSSNHDHQPQAAATSTHMHTDATVTPIFKNKNRMHKRLMCAPGTVAHISRQIT
jgi:hypothetical protein